MNWSYIQPMKIRFGSGLRNSIFDEIHAINGINGLLITSPSFEYTTARTGFDVLCHAIDAYLSQTPAAYLRCPCNPCGKAGYVQSFDSL